MDKTVSKFIFVENQMINYAETTDRLKDKNEVYVKLSDVVDLLKDTKPKDIDKTIRRLEKLI